MLYTVFLICTSIPEVHAEFEVCDGKLNHFNLTHVPEKSLLTDGNEKRKRKVFGVLYQRLFERYKGIISDFYFYNFIKQDYLG